MSGTPAIREVDWFVHTDDHSLRREIGERERRLNLRTAADPDAVAWTWQAIRLSDRRNALRSLRLPALILHGADDEDCPVSGARAFAEGIAGAQLRVIEGAGHALPSSHSAAVADAVRQFIIR
jgi:pimeloyl-ACP methyl ester carboxylesterase